MLWTAMFFIARNCGRQYSLFFPRSGIQGWQSICCNRVWRYSWKRQSRQKTQMFKKLPSKALQTASSCWVIMPLDRTLPTFMELANRRRGTLRMIVTSPASKFLCWRTYVTHFLSHCMILTPAFVHRVRLHLRNYDWPWCMACDSSALLLRT